jgi:hypothetical protein
MRERHPGGDAWYDKHSRRGLAYTVQMYGFNAQLVLPYNLSESEAVRLNALILTLVVPEAPSVTAAQETSE